MNRPKVFYTPSEYESVDGGYWRGTVSVVFDVLRATTSLVNAFGNGAREAHCVLTLEEARELKQSMPDALLCGERQGIKPEGFDIGNSPGDYRQELVRGKRMIMTTTNGTRAIRAAIGSDVVILAALRNLRSCAGWIRKNIAGRPLNLLLAGTFDDFALEDAVGASALIRLLEIEHPLASFYDTGESNVPELLRASVNGRKLDRMGLGQDVDFAMKMSVSNVVPSNQTENGGAANLVFALSSDARDPESNNRE